MVTKSEYSGETTEQLLVTDFSNPYSLNPLNVDSYQFDMDVIISAKVTQTDGKVVGYALPATVYEPNETPSALTFVQTQNVNENTDPDASEVWVSFGTLSAVDGNEYQTHTYTLNEGIHSSNFRISASTLEYKSTIDFESMFGTSSSTSNTVDLSILVNDGTTGAEADTCCRTFTKTIQVFNVNEPPVSVDSSSFTFNENTNVDSILHSFSISDPDGSWQSHTCSLSGADGYFDIVGNCQLKLVAPLDYENRQAHNFNLNVADNGSPTAQSVFAITVNVGNINEAPTAIEMFRPSVVAGYSCTDPGIACTVPEKAVGGATDGTIDGTVIAHLRVKDPECAGFPNSYKTPTDCAGSTSVDGAANTVTLSLQSGGEYFDLVDTTSIPKLKTKIGGTALDYEIIPASGLSITVRATDNIGNFYDQSLSIYVTDIDEPPQAYPLVCTFEENTPNGLIAGLVSAGARTGEICMVQASAAGDEELEFTITGGADASKFTIQSCSGIVFLDSGAGDFNFEDPALAPPASNPYTFNVQVTGSASADPITVTLYLSDVNEAPAFSDASVSISEREGFDDINDDSFTVATVTSLSAVDPELHSKVFSILSGNDGNVFQVVNGVSPYLQLTSPLNYEVQTSYVLNMQVVDVPGAGKEPKTDTAQITITVDPANERPVFSSYGNIFAQVLETKTAVSSGDGTASDYIGSMIIATDEDHTSDVLTYTITGCTPSPMCNGAFRLRDNTETVADLNNAQVQRLMVADSSKLDYENTNPSVATNTFSVTVSVSDGRGGTDTVTLNVVVADANEAPILNVNTKIEWSFDECGDNLSSCDGYNYFIGSCSTCTDPDNNLPDTSACASCASIKSSTVDLDLYNGAPDTYTYQLLGRTAGDTQTDADGKFAIDTATGVITLAQDYLDYEAAGIHRYIIRVTDIREQFSDTFLDVTVGNVPEPPVITGADATGIFENLLPGTYVSRTGTYTNADFSATNAMVLSCADADGNLPATGALTLVDSSIPFALEAVSEGTDLSTYKLKTTSELDYETLANPTYAVELQCTDAGDPALTHVVTWSITVSNENDTPSWPNQRDCFVARDAAANSNICGLLGENAASDGDSFALSDKTGKLTYSIVSVPTVTNGTCAAVGAAGSSFFTIVGQETEGPYLAFPASHSTLASSCGDAVVTMTMQACDGGGAFEPIGLGWGTGSTASCSEVQTVTVALTAVNDPPVCGSIAGATFTINENLGNAVSITTLADTGKIVDSDSGIASLEITSGSSITQYFAISGHDLVTTATPLDYETLKEAQGGVNEPEYSITVRVTDSGTPALETSCTFNVQVGDVNEPTTFTDMSLNVDENANAGDISSQMLSNTAHFQDEDEDDQNGAFSFTNTGDASSSPFEIVSTTGQLRLKVSNSLDYETTPSYSYPVTWSNRDVTETATLTVQVNDQSEPPVITPGQVFSMNEGYVGSVGSIAATDPDFVDSIGSEDCGARCGLVYSIVSMGTIFRIDSNTGELSTTSDASDFESQASYSIDIGVCDNSCDGVESNPVQTGTITVNVVNVDDCAVSNIYDSSFEGNSGFTSEFATTGNEKIYLVGTNLFPTVARRDADTGITSDASIEIIASLHQSSDSGAVETLDNCVINRMANKPGLDIIECRTSSGAGGPYGAEISISVPYAAGQVVCTTEIQDGDGGGLLGATKTYKAPVISQVGCLGSDSACTNLPTTGNIEVTITGTDFGPNGSTDSDSAVVVTATYGPYTTGACTHSNANHNQVVCTTLAGVGAGHKWSVTVKGQTSAEFASVTTNYAISTVTQVKVRKGETQPSEGLSTEGNERIEVIGTNLGGALPGECPGTSLVCPTVEYGTQAQFHSGTQYVATGCQPANTAAYNGHTKWICNSVAGSGVDLHAKFTVGGQSSTPDWTCVRDSTTVCDSWYYMQPTITAVTGPGTYRASSMGGQVVYIQGTQFGPKLATLADGSDPSYDYITVTYGPASNPSAYTAEGCVVSTSHTFLTCFTGPGTGKDHSWYIDVGGSASAAPFAPCVGSQTTENCLGSNYAPPIVAYYEGLGTKYDFDAASNPSLVYGDTRGTQTISILGRNFGTDISKVELVTYKADSEDAIVFAVHNTGDAAISESCTISVAHQTLTCETAEGAGDEMKWSVRVDGQDSEEPTTGYQGPVISALQSEAPVVIGGLSNYGGEFVTITGDFFGPSTTDSDDFIDWVKYGPNLHEYTAQDCTVASHTSIVCKTAQGVGAESKWAVMIAGQESIFDPSGPVPVSSYALPVVETMTPSEYPTDGNLLVTITGSNLGTFTKPGTTFGGVPLEDTEIILGGVQDTLYFMLPAGIGRDLVVQLNVGGQMSNTKLFSYQYPVIQSVHSVDLVPPEDSRVKVVILGSSFSSGPIVKMRVDGVDLTLPCDVTGHSEINCYTDEYDGFIRVEWSDGTQSNEYEFKRGNPVVLYNSLVEGDATGAATSGGGNIKILCQYCGTDESQLEVFVYNHARGIYVDDTAHPKVENDPTVRCVVVSDSLTEAQNPTDVSPEPSATWAGYMNDIATVDPGEGQPGHIAVNTNEKIQKFTCTLPQGQDTLQSVVVRKLGTTKISMMCHTAVCIECTFGPCFNYDPPTLTDVETAPLSDVTGGGKSFALTGTNFGLDMVVNYGPYALTLTERSHTRLVGTVGEGVGAGKMFVVSVGSQSTTSSTFVFNYDIPALDDVTSLDNIGTRGTSATDVAAITLNGQNFGDSDIEDYAGTGPILTIGADTVPITSYDHTSITFDVPEGQGIDLPFVVNVQGQVNTAQTFTYLPPVITSTSSTSGGSLNLESDTKGGRDSNEQITLVGTNFGVINKDWSLILEGKTVDGVKEGNVVVTSADITPGGEWDHERIIFYVPEGQGIEKALILTVGGQVATNQGGSVTCGGREAAACFSYKPPVLHYWNVTEGQMLNTNGGYEITLTGTSFGTSGAEVTFFDPLYDAADEINTQRMSDTCDDTKCNKCIIVSQDHEEIICKVPRGWGSDLHITLSVDGAMSTTDDRVVDGETIPGHGKTFSYAKPVIEFIVGSEAGDASGNEELRVYGENFGPFRTNVIMKIGNDTCKNAFWTNDDPIFDNEPYIKCPSSTRATVGIKNVTIEVAFSESNVFDRWEVECKAGFYGKNNEFCAACGDPLLTGYVCERDGLANPYAFIGWWNIEQEVGSPGASRCHEEMTTGTREFCPTMWPCMPGEACLGNNTCMERYDPESERCSDCNLGYFKLNGQCAECPEKPWAIALCIIIVGGTAAYIGSKLDKNQVNLGIITIGVDYFQVLAIFSSANVDWPDELTNLWNMLSAFNLNIDLAAPECWQGADFTYDQKWMVVEFTPLALMLMSFAVYVIKYCFKRFKGRRARLHSHAPKLFGTTVTIFYYTYLYVTTKTLSVFNCQPTMPSDGFQYMTEVGTGDGICYQEGSMQQKLEPWAYVTFLLYTLGFPAFCGILLYFNRMTCFLDQVMKAARKTDEELKACGTYKFRKMWHRLYHYYKPQYFYWILIVLFRKFMIAVTSLVFRGNTLFMLSMTLLVIIVMYALQVKYSPYMSTAEYDGIVSANSAMIDEVTSMKLMQLKIMQSQNQRSKAAKLGRESLIHMGPKMELSFLHNYNTVESSLLFSAIIVNLSGIMFESGQLDGGYKKALTYFIITLVVASLFYFVWVLATELWTAFYPNKPFLGMPCLNIGTPVDDDDAIRESSLVFDANPLASNPGMGINDADGKKLEYLEKELNKMWGNVAQKDKLIKAQQDEIRSLKKGGGVNKFQGLAKNVISINKEKKKFGKIDKRPSTRKGLGNVSSMGGSTRNALHGASTTAAASGGATVQSVAQPVNGRGRVESEVVLKEDRISESRL